MPLNPLPGSLFRSTFHTMSQETTFSAGFCTMIESELQARRQQQHVLLGPRGDRGVETGVRFQNEARV